MRSVRISLAAVLVVLALPSAAGAQTASPFTPIPQPAPEQPAPAPAPASSSSSDDGLSTSAQIIMFGGGVLILAAIGYGIWWDARRRAPVAAGETGFEETKTTPHAKKQQNRAKDKRAKAARKRNRR
jgi:hypothetical protein